MKTILSLKAICLCFIWFLSVDAVQAHKDKTWQPKALNVHDSTFVPDYTLRISASDIQINCETRHSVVLNGTSPGPTLRLKQNQIVWIRVYNDMPDTNSTIHWHGLSQRVAPFSDGTPQASQWPIPPGHFFDYEIYPDKAGTFMYHSHVGFQAVSCYGALIVEEATKPVYQYDEELVILIADYFNQTDKPIEQGLMADPFVWSGGTNAILFNGQSGTAIGSGAKDQSCQPMPLQVKPDTTYRVRLICATAISFVTIGLEGHDNLTIIEADGTDSKPYSTDHIQMGSGQRYSLLLRTKSAADCKSANKYSYWLRYENREEVDSSMAGYGLFEYNVPGIASAQLAALPASPPMNLPTQVTDWTEYALSPFNPSLQPFPTKADRTLHIKVEQKGIAVNGKVVSRLEWAQNGDVWKEEKIDVPYMVQFYKEGASAFPDWDLAIANNGWDPRNLAFPAKTGEVIDIIWESNNSPTGGFEVHPMHAHGVHYFDLGSGGGTYDASANEQRLKGYNPMIRDTTMLYRYATTAAVNTTSGWRAWRLKMDEVGAFMMHCHILPHIIMGMSTAWIVGNYSQLIDLWPKPPYISGYLDYGGDAYGNATYDPRVFHFFESL